MEQPLGQLAAGDVRRQRLAGQRSRRHELHSRHGRRTRNSADRQRLADGHPRLRRQEGARSLGQDADHPGAEGIQGLRRQPRPDRLHGTPLRPLRQGPLLEYDGILLRRLDRRPAGQGARRRRDLPHVQRPRLLVAQRHQRRGILPHARQQGPMARKLRSLPQRQPALRRRQRMAAHLLRAAGRPGAGREDRQAALHRPPALGLQSGRGVALQRPERPVLGPPRRAGQPAVDALRIPVQLRRHAVEHPALEPLDPRPLLRLRHRQRLPRRRGSGTDERMGDHDLDRSVPDRRRMPRGSGLRNRQPDFRRSDDRPRRTLRPRQKVYRQGPQRFAQKHLRAERPPERQTARHVPLPGFGAAGSWFSKWDPNPTRAGV